MNSIVLPIAVTIITLTVSTGTMYLLSVRRTRAREGEIAATSARPVASITGRLPVAVQDSESLATIVANPVADPVIHLKGAVRISPTNYQDTAKRVLDHLRSSRVVILDLATIDESLASRLVDFCSGVTLGSNGWLYSVSSSTVLLAPSAD